MTPSILDYRQLLRNRSGPEVQESMDFLINSRPLLPWFTKISGGHADYVGPFVRRFTTQIPKTASEAAIPAHTAQGFHGFSR